MSSVIHMLTSHMKRYSTVHNYHANNPIKFIYIETNNDPLASDYVTGEMYKLDKVNTRVESRDPRDQGRVGIWTSPDAKRIYHDLILYIMSTDSLRIAEDVISVNKEARLSELFSQIKNFRRIEEPESENPAFQDKIKVRFSGKGGGLKDDLLLALMISLRWLVEKRTEEKFVKEMNLKGIVDF